MLKQCVLTTTWVVIVEEYVPTMCPNNVTIFTKMCPHSDIGYVFQYVPKMVPVPIVEMIYSTISTVPTITLGHVGCPLPRIHVADRQTWTGL